MSSYGCQPSKTTLLYRRNEAGHLEFERYKLMPIIILTGLRTIISNLLDPVKMANHDGATMIDYRLLKCYR